MSDEESIKTTLMIPESLLWEMKEIAVKRRISNDSEAIRMAIRFWVDYAECHNLTSSSDSNFSALQLGQTGYNALDPVIKDWVDVLISILQSKHVKARGIATEVLAACAQLIKSDVGGIVDRAEAHAAADLSVQVQDPVEGSRTVGSTIKND